MTTLRMAGVLVAIAAAACSPSIDSQNSAGAGGSGGAGTMASASVGGVTSTSGTGGVLVTSSSSSSTGGGAGGFGGACEQGVIELVADGNAIEFTHVCPNSWAWMETTRPDGYLVLGGGFVGNLEIDGCDGGARRLTAFAVDSGAGGNSAPASLSYVDAAGAAWNSAQGDGAMLDVMTFGPIGTLIEGTFEGPVHRQDGATMQVSAKYSVCRVNDEALP